MWPNIINYYFYGLVLSVQMLSSAAALECGQRKVNINQAIVRGQSTSPGDWPWHVAIYHLENTDSINYACGGTLISEIFVLTADHCVRDDNEQVISYRRIFVRLGLHHLQHLNRKTFQQHNIYKIHRYTSTEKLKNDIAILELSTEAEMTEFVQPACLNLVQDLTGQYGTAVGWGVDESDEVSPTLKSHRMPVISTNECLESNDGLFRSVLDSSLFCAGYLNGTTVCNGDSGGGLHFDRNGAWYVGGIVSFTAPRLNSFQCHLKSYAGFTNIYHFLPWIRKVTGLGRLTETKGNNREPEDITAESYPNLLPQNPVSSTGTIFQEKRYDLLPQDCGRYLVNRIFGGTNANLYEFPWVAQLLHVNKSTDRLTHDCHGSLINKRYVLTNAWCALHEKYKPELIKLGEYDSSRNVDCNVNNPRDCAPPPVFARVESIIVHPNYDYVSIRNNVALIRLDRNIEFQVHIQPICLPVTQSLRQQRPQQYIVAGWGQLRDDLGYPTVMQKAVVRVTDKTECKNKGSSRFYLGDNDICTGANLTPNTCSWDQGTPLGYPARYNERIRFVQYGITSIVGCENYPTIYGYVPDYLDWILASLRP